MTWTLTFNGIRAFTKSGPDPSFFKDRIQIQVFFSPDLQFCTHIHTFITGESCLRRAYIRGLNFQQNAGSYLHRAYTQWSRISGNHVYEIGEEKMRSAGM